MPVARATPAAALAVLHSCTAAASLPLADWQAGTGMLSEHWHASLALVEPASGSERYSVPLALAVAVAIVLRLVVPVTATATAR